MVRDLRRHRQVLNEGKALTTRMNEAKQEVAKLQPVLKEGRIAVDLAVDARRPRQADDPRVLQLERRVLAAV